MITVVAIPCCVAVLKMHVITVYVGVVQLKQINRIMEKTFLFSAPPMISQVNPLYSAVGKQSAGISWIFRICSIYLLRNCSLNYTFTATLTTVVLILFCCYLQHVFVPLVLKPDPSLVSIPQNQMDM